MQSMARISAVTKQGELTILAPATSRSQSLRTTVPIGIIRQLGLKEGDGLVWELRPNENQLIVVVSPMRNARKS
jgi:hypothetical protein